MQPHARPILAVVFACIVPLWCLPAHAEPVVVESGWTLVQTIDFASPVAARLDPATNQIFVGRRATSSDGIYRVDELGLAEKVAAASNPAGLVVADSSTVFFSEDYGGAIYRYRESIGARETWVSGLHSGDDDPVGLDIAPADYAGSVLTPGEALVVDRGNSGLDEVWRWSPLSPENETVLHADDGTLVDAVDVAIDRTTVFVVDAAGGSPGVLYELGVAGDLTPFPTSTPLPEPRALAFDPSNDDLLVLDATDDRLVRVDRITGDVSDVLTGIDVGLGWSGVDVSADGRLLLVTAWDEDRVYLYGRCDATGAPEVDCDGNGVYDVCDIRSGAAADCNRNFVPDECDFSAGTSEDCNLDGIPDECPVCPPVEVVFVMDTSTSMDDEASALCADIADVVTRLEAAGLQTTPTLLGICDQPGGAYGCLQNDVSTLLGTTVPGNPPSGFETLGECPGGNEVCQEDWARATAVVAGSFPWQPEGDSVRLVIPLSDEGTWCGDPVTSEDQAVTTHAISVARDHGVIVSPITGTGSSNAVVEQAQAIADSTGGLQFSSSAPNTDVADAIVDLVLSACASFTDCNGNGTLDECDISSGSSQDSDGDGVPDECESVVAAPPSRSSVLGLVEVWPNPFNPALSVRFELTRSVAMEVSVYSVDGRRVRTLLRGQQEAGVRTLRWDGRDEAGRSVSSGTYFVRLRADTVVRTQRVVLLK